MKKRLAVLNKNQSPEQGFSIVISTGFGLVIMMIGLTIMGRAMKDNSVSASQKIITRSDAAAQTGTTRYLALISQYPILAGYKDCVDRATSGACNDTGNTKSWANAAAFSTSQLSTAGKAAAVAYATTDWQDIDTSNASKGQFKLASYTPPPTGTGLGTVKIDGRINQKGSGTTATNDVQTGSGKSEAEVAYVPPVTTTTLSFSGSAPAGAPTSGNVSESNIAFPGLWLRQAPDNTSGGQYYNATGLLENSSSPSSAVLKTYKMNSDGTFESTATSVAKTNLRIADFLPAKPTIPTSNVLGAITKTSSNLSLPRTGDTFTTETINGISTKVYRYSLTSFEGNGNNTQVTVNTVNGGGGTSAQKVIFYVDGNINPGGNGDIEHLCGTGVTCNLTNFMIYGYGASGSKICSQGSHAIQGFIIAPNYTVGGNASGGGKGAFQGAVWANNWSTSNSDCGNNNSNQLMVTQTGTWNDVANWTETAKITNQPTGTTLVSSTPATVGRKTASTP